MFPLKFLLHIPSFFIVIIIRLINPFVIVRIATLEIGRIGGAYNAELYLSEKKCGQYKSGFLDVFYFLKSTDHVNQQWKKMWERELNILFFSGLAQSVKRVNRLFPGYKKYQINDGVNGSFRKDYKKYVESRDPAIYAKFNKLLNSILRVKKPNLSFTSEEIFIGDRNLREIGISEKTSFICFHNRDSAFLDFVKSDYDWNYHNYKDSSIQNYLNAAEAIIKRGNYVVRLGSITKDKAKSASPKLIDYANNGMRTDFLDIYLSAKCKFILCSETGMSFPAEVFKRPIVYVNWTGLLWLPVYTLNGLIIFKKFYLRNEDRYMTFSEMINCEFGGPDTNDIFTNLGIELIENTPEEICDVTIEMDERLNGTWKTTKEDEELQHRFWDLFGLDKIKSPDLRIGSEYLTRNKELLE